MPESLTVIVLVMTTFVAAGWVKGVVGLGLPVVAMGGLGLLMSPVEAAALLVVPSLFTNAWQLLAGPALRVVTRRLALMMFFICVGTALGIQFLTSGSSRWPSVALGSVLALYALLSLLLPRFVVPAHLETRLSMVAGVVTGIVTGATGVFAVPAVPYLSALGMTREELIQALGLSFTVSTLALAVALGVSGNYSRAILLTSFSAVIPALLGMYVGQLLRNRLHPEVFRKWFFVAMLLVGVYMALRALATK